MHTIKMQKLLVLVLLVVASSHCDPSLVEVVQDVYDTCLRDFSTDCVKPKALTWFDQVKEKSEIKVTEDLTLIKKNADRRELSHDDDVLDHFEDFIQSHDLVAKVPQLLRPDGPLGQMIPRSFQAEELKVPLAVTGRSKVVKKVIVPFLLGLKFKTAILVPLALSLIALKTWKALTLGLLSLVLTGALLIFKLSKPKVNYEVVHFPQHVEHHVEHPPVAGWEHPGYGRQMDPQEMAYNAYSN